VTLSGCGHPRPWNYTITAPKEIDLVGEYRAVRYNGDFRSVNGFSINDPIEIVLSADHTAQGSALPKFDGFGDFVLCKLSGSADWAISSGLGSQDLVLHFKLAPKIIASEHPELRRCTNDWEVTILGHHAPYSFYLSMGDPGEDKGIEFIRTSR